MIKRKFLTYGIPIVLSASVVTGVATAITNFNGFVGWWAGFSLKTGPDDFRNNYLNNKFYDKYNIGNGIDSISGYYESEPIQNSDTIGTFSQYYTQSSTINDMKNFKYPGYNFNYKRIYYSNDNKLNTLRDFVEKNYDNVQNEKVGKSGNNENDTRLFSDTTFIAEQINSTSKFQPKNGEYNSGTNLKKHPAADVLQNPKFFLKPDTKTIKKDFKVSNLRKGIYNTGIYVPAGHVIEITFDEATFQMFKKGYKNFRFIIYNNSFESKRGLYNSGAIDNKYHFIKSIFPVEVKPKDIKPEEAKKHLYIDETTKTMKIGSPFGGSLSFEIRGPYKNEVTSDNSMSFSINKGVEELHYVQNFTTEEDWKKQLEKFKKGEITAPSLSVDSFWLSTNFPLYSKEEEENFAVENQKDSFDKKTSYKPKTDEIQNNCLIGYNSNYKGGWRVVDLKFPKSNIDKWDDFITISNYFASQDIHNSATKDTFYLQANVWGGAIGWGGSWYLYTVPQELMVSLFGNEYDYFSVSRWLTMHEINHGFSSGNWGFINNSHGPTNQVTISALSVLADNPRFRTERDYDAASNGSGWNRISTPYASAVTSSRDEYTLAANFLWMFGTSKYFQWVRFQQANAGKNGNLAHGGLKELVTMSNIAGINIYSGIARDYQGKFTDKEVWPLKWQDGNDEQKRLIYSISHLPAVDTIANMYAVGPYLYDYKTKQFNYTNDLVPPFEIAAGTEHTFYFDQFIKSTNPNFDFNISSFDSKTKNGGSLRFDPSNNKRLIYTPNKDNIESVDEFDLTIKPTNFKDKPDNYVPYYKWKIKVRQNINSAVANINYKNTNTNITISGGNFNGTNVNNSNSLKFYFIAPKDGNYNFNLNKNSKIFVDGSEKNYNEKFNWKKDQSYLIEIKNINKINELNLTFTNNNNSSGTVNSESINLINNVISPNVDKSMVTRTVLNDQKYKYIPRKLPSNGYGLFGVNYFGDPFGQIEINPVDKKSLKLKNVIPSKNLNAIKYLSSYNDENAKTNTNAWTIKTNKESILKTNDANKNNQFNLNFENFSNFDNSYVVTETNNASFKFSFNGIGFSLNGLSSTESINIDVYVDGVLVEQNKDIKSKNNKKEFNSILYTYVNKTNNTVDKIPKEHVVEIVVKNISSSNKFYLNAIGIISSTDDAGWFNKIN
ncbi:hypothetical protein [Malacoplasma iowae]|uniref:hypothetical protein n=1 Tax=Malacoplasma iowae TaxID=2116 RepID=UPI002A18A2B1|nr:hypothetical protein [Malacoplasma iowae]WPL40002.1 hypothetical protein QX183_00440 [Malacoplasma iowae]